MYEVYLTNGETREKLHEMNQDSNRRLSLCEFTSGVNLIPSAELAMFPFNPCYESINPMTSIVEIVNTKTGKTEFEGRVLKIPTSGMDSSGIIAKRITCEGFLGYLHDSIQVYREFNGISAYELFSAILEYHNQNVPEEKKIYPGACDISGNIWEQHTEYAQTMSEIKRLLLGVFGGELWLRRNDQNQLVLDWLKTPEESIVSDTTIELSKNMMSLNVDSDATHIITRLIPLGAKLTDADTGAETGERLTISGEADGYIGQGQTLYKHGICIDDVNAMAQYGVICGTAVFDDIDSSHPLVEMASTYIQNNNRIKKSYKAEVLDLSTIGLDPDALEVGKAYRFVNRLIPLDDTLRLTKKTVDIFKAHSPVVEIGDKAEKITDIATRAVNFIEYEMPKVKTNILDSAKATATSLITNATNGYVVFHDSNNDGVPDEILIMDAPTTSTATKVWRWNSAGLGYSNTGYNGTYGLAMTMNGAIVADFITTGVLRSLQIINGNNGEFSVDSSGALRATNATITGGSIDLQGSYGGIEFKTGTTEVAGYTYYGGTFVFKNSSGNAIMYMFGNGVTYVWNGNNWVSGSLLNLLGEGVAAFSTVNASSVIIKSNNRTFVVESILQDLNNRVTALENA